jgi:UDP-glucose 4-epimerase
MPLNVIVTGAGGVIGRRLLPLLQARGHNVISVGRDRPRDAAPFLTVNGDLFDVAVREQAIALLRDDGSRESAIVHLAARSNVAAASAGRTAAFESGVVLTRLMLEMAASADVSRFLFASSGYVYGVGGAAPIREDQVPRPRSMYAATKLAAEALVQGYAAECRIAGTIFRMSNVYGPDSPDSTVAGRLLSQLRQRQPVNVASRLPIRDFIFIDDVAEAICALLESPVAAVTDIFNISTGVGTSVGALVDTAIAAAHGTACTTKSPDIPGEDCLILSNERICKRTGWAPRHSLADSMRLCLGAR